MNNSAFRTLVLSEGGEAFLRDGMLMLMRDDETLEFPISQLSSVIINTGTLKTTSALMSALTEAGVSVIFCNERKQPSGVLYPLYVNFDSAGRIMDQASWRDNVKSFIWSEIVRQKIINSAALLRSVGLIDEAEIVEGYRHEIQNGDKTNREAVCAKVYFHFLFGYSFTRDYDCDINAALNYGYSIIASHISRFLTSYGYCTALGFHHCSRGNVWNLTYDLIEPFRVFVDEIVYKNQGAPFDWEYKKALIEIGETYVRYDGKRMIITNAIENFCISVLKGLMSDKITDVKIGKVEMM